MFTACKRKLWERRRYKLCGLLITAVVGASFCFFGYFCDDRLCRLTTAAGSSGASTQHHAQLSYKLSDGSTDAQTTIDDDDLSRDYPFDIEGHDVMVFLHMQKTGGTTFGRHLVRNLNVNPPCRCHRGRKRCDCLNKKNQRWLFSRYSIGWPCGLHADWTELQNCVDETMNKKEQTVRPRRYLYISMLREPLLRYLSEWKHVRRGSTWLAARLRCNGRQATLEEVPFCFDGKSSPRQPKSISSIHDDWSGVSLKEFLSCPHNLANDRQTRMLANLSLVGCYNHSAMLPAQRGAIMLHSAKTNLREMAFFGLVEYQRATQYMFERTFHMKFFDNFEQYSRTHAKSVDVNDAQRERVLEVNKLDIELYRYAKELFMKRLHKMRATDGTLDHYDTDTLKTRNEYEEDDNYDDDDEIDANRH